MKKSKMKAGQKKAEKASLGLGKKQKPQKAPLKGAKGRKSMAAAASKVLQG